MFVHPRGFLLLNLSFISSCAFTVRTTKPISLLTITGGTAAAYCSQLRQPTIRVNSNNIINQRTLVRFLMSPTFTSNNVNGTIDNGSLQSTRQRLNSDDSTSSNSSDDSAKRIVLPVLKYGYRTEPFEWDELVNVLVVEQDIAKLSRSVEQQKDYEIYKRDLLRKWRTVYDHVLCSKFSNLFERRVDSETNLSYAFPPRHEVTTVTKSLVQNDFPYYMDDGIEHWILWKLVEPCTDEDIAEAQQDLKETKNLTDFLYWVNPPHLKSLPDIDHVHILGRR